MHVVAQKLDRALHQRYRADLASFSQKTQLRGWIQSHISDGKIDQFLNARSGVVEDTQQDGISSTFWGSEIRLRQNLRQFFFRKVCDGGTSVSLLGNREDFLALKHVGRFFGLNVSEECVQSGKPMVSCAGRRIPFGPQVIQECFHQRNVDLFEAEFFRRDSPHVAAESQKQSEHVAVGLDGIGAEIPLRGQSNASRSSSREWKNRWASSFDPPWNDFTKGRIESCGDFGKEFGGEMQVTLSSGKMLMPQVGGQKRKFGVEILTVSIPASKVWTAKRCRKSWILGPLPRPA